MHSTVQSNMMCDQFVVKKSIGNSGECCSITDGICKHCKDSHAVFLCKNSATDGEITIKKMILSYLFVDSNP